MDPLNASDPTQVGVYRLEARLGEGGMGTVYLGVAEDDRAVAVKLLKPELAEHPEFRTRFAREAEAARQVGGVHTAQVIDADPEATPPWLATEYIPGPSLHQVVRDGGPLDTGAAFTLGAGLAEGLAAIHACGLVHRDLKPGNVIMADDGPRIIDFGVARAVDASTLTGVGTVIGTYAYMSPEQIRADEAEPSSDVFALGCVLGFAATGRGPFDATSLPAITHRILNEPPNLDSVADPLRGLIEACLAKDPRDRPEVNDLAARCGAFDPRVPPTMVDPAPPAAVAQVSAPTNVLPEDDTEVRSDAPRRHVPRRSLLVGGAAALAAVTVPIVALWPESAEPEENGAGDTKDEDERTLTADGEVSKLAFSADGATLAVGTWASGGDSGVELWDVASGERTISFAPQGYHMVFGPGDTSIVTCGGTEDELATWDVASGEKIAAIAEPKMDVHILAAGPDGETVAMVGIGDDGEENLTLWNVSSGEKIATVSDDADITGGLAFSPDGKVLGHVSDNVRLWDAATGERIPTSDDAGAGRGIAFSPDGKSIAIVRSATAGGGVQFLDAATGDPRSEIDVPADIDTLEFGPDSTTIVTAGLDPEGSGGAGVYLWDAPTGERLDALTRGPCGSMVVSPDGKYVAGAGTGDDAARIYLWKLDQSR